MAPYVFPGYPEFLQRAAKELGLPEDPATTGQVRVLTNLSNLCSQIGSNNPGHAAAILAKANEYRDLLRVALRAAELMIGHVEAGCTTSEFRSAEAPSTTHSVPHPSRSKRRGKR